MNCYIWRQKNFIEFKKQSNYNNRKLKKNKNPMKKRFTETGWSILNRNASIGSITIYQIN